MRRVALISILASALVLWGSLASFADDQGINRDSLRIAVDTLLNKAAQYSKEWTEASWNSCEVLADSALYGGHRRVASRDASLAASGIFSAFEPAMGGRRSGEQANSGAGEQW